MDRSWIEVRIFTGSEAALAVEGRLFEMGSLGVVTGGMETAYVEDLDPEPAEDPGAPRTLAAYFDAGEGRAEKLVEELLLYGASLKEIWGEEFQWSVEARLVSDEGWAEAWRAWFRPTRLTERLTVCPVDEPYAAAPGELVLRLDPGLAFGTGLHATTRLALRLIENAMEREPGETFLDVGCGTGILAFAALRLGAREAVGVDTDSEAVRVARENSGINGLADRARFEAGSAAEVPGVFDLVGANILAEVHARLAPDIIARARPGGAILLSGVLADREGLVREAFKSCVLVERLEEEGWTALAYRKAGP